MTNNKENSASPEPMDGDSAAGGNGAGDDSERASYRLSEITLDAASIARTNANIQHEREVAIYDLIDDNYFKVEKRDEGAPIPGPYHLNIAIAESRLVLNVSSETSDKTHSFMLSLSPMRRIIKDYFMICDSYYEAIKSAPASRIEAIDMGRRGLHDDGSKILMERLEGKIKLDFKTARRLFTLICALHWKG